MIISAKSMYGYRSLRDDNLTYPNFFSNAFLWIKKKS